MSPEEFFALLADNHRNLILLGGVICFISLFLPFFRIDAVFTYDAVVTGGSASLSTTWLFWIFLIVIGGMYYGFFQGYGEKYPYLFLAAGGLLVLLTLYGTQLYAGGNNIISILYGFFCEVIGSLAVTAGGYYYYQEHISTS
jgi:hypothetical protein